MRKVTGDISRLSTAHQAIAGTYGYLLRPKDGLPHARRALELAEESEDRASIAYAKEVGIGDLM